MFGWLKRRRRAQILSEPFPAEWGVLLDRDVALWRLLSEAERLRLQDDLRIFMAERNWEPCGGLEFTDAMRAVIAAQACILTLGRTVDAFAHVRTILVYPDRFFAPEAEEDEFGVVTESCDDREGEAWERGQVVLSWSDVRQDSRRLDGRNLVLHEFSHQLDLLDFISAARAVSRDEAERHHRWREVLLGTYEALCELDDVGRKDPVLDTYGAENESECFAVATEAFFERPIRLRQFHPELYQVLAEYYNQDPAARMEGESGRTGEGVKEKTKDDGRGAGAANNKKNRSKSKFQWTRG